MDKKTYYELHRDEIIARVARWQKDNPEKHKEHNRKYLETHRQAKNKRSAEYKRENIEVVRKKGREHYHKNKDKYVAYRKAHASKIKEANKAYHKSMPSEVLEKKRAYDKEYAKRNRGKLSARMKAWRLANPQKHLETIKRYRKAHPEVATANRNLRRARLSGIGGKYTAKEWQSLCKSYDYRCLACGEEKPLTVDHVLPISLGGTNTIDNIQPLCRSCNARKHDKHIDYRPK